MTATSAEALQTATRLLRWQTHKRARILDPEGRVVQEITGEEPTGAEPLSGGPPQDAGSHG